MIEFKRYPHVKDIIEHYAKQHKNSKIIEFLKSGIDTEEEAFLFCRFVLLVVDSIAYDMDNKVSVLGNADNTSMIPDIDYEVSLYLADIGKEDIWDQVCEE